MNSDEATILSDRPKHSVKYIPSIRPVACEKHYDLIVVRTDGIKTRLKCPACGSSAFETQKTFLRHLIQDEDIGLVEDPSDQRILEMYPDLLALEFGTILELSEQSDMGQNRIKKLIDMNFNPNKQLYDETKDDKDDDSFKFLREKMQQHGQDLDNILGEIKHIDQ